MLKKLLKLLLTILLILPCFGRDLIYAEDDEEEERSNYDKCVYDRDATACEIILKEKKKTDNEIRKQIEAVTEDKEAAAALANSYAQQAAALQGEIDQLKAQIDELKEKITQLEIQIAENEQKVEELNTRVKNRMEQSQKTMHFNGYLEFILGSKSFSDMLSRVYGVKAIVSKDKSDREELLDVIEQLNADKAELDESKAKLDESYEEIVIKQAELIEMEEFYEEQERLLEMEIDELNNQLINTEISFSDAQRIISDLGINVDFVAAVHNSWISSTVWNYSADFLDGKWHLGVDYAASRGTEIHAPASGVIIRANGGCADPGSLGSLAGDPIMGGGNQVYLMCEVDGKVYAFIFFHMHSIYVSAGQTVDQDEVIGTVGSSGSSTGPHCHIEMYYLGDGWLADYLEMSWNATFSVGRGRTAYNNRCYYDDGSFRQSAPCILNPEWYLPEN